MDARKPKAEAGHPADKSVVIKAAAPKEEIAPKEASSVWTKVQTAEGWKRSIKKTRAKKG